MIYDLHIFVFFRMSSAIEVKYLLEELAISFGFETFLSPCITQVGWSRFLDFTLTIYFYAFPNHTKIFLLAEKYVL